MTFTPITTHEMKLLEQMRLARLRELLAQSLSRLPIYIDPQNRLNIFCPKPSIINHLLADIANLRNHAWQILGVTNISIYLVDKEDWPQICNHIWLD
jgi:hypothetical protein